MGVHDGHRERLRARFLKEGLENFEEHTALELLLFYGRPRCDTNEIAHALIARFGSFSAVLDAPMEDLLTVEGVGETTAILLKMVPELGSFYLENRLEAGDVLDSTAKAGAYFLPKFFGKRVEEVYMVALDDKRKVLRCSCVSQQGVVNAVSLSVHKILEQTIRAGATGVVLAHNHPGGVALPSARDKLVTKEVYTALRYINARLLDHIIVADGDFVSLADSGFFESLAREEF